MNKILTILSILLTMAFVDISAQTIDVSDLIDKKTSDAELTEELKNFVCNNPEFTDSLYHSILGKYAYGAPFLLSITHRRYGEIPPPIAMTLEDLICMFFDEFDIYFSVEEAADGMVSLTTVFSHKAFNYLHMLVAKIPRREFLQRRHAIKADFYSYIPQKFISKKEKQQ